ncbi:CaiB/BaiF CoA-transferase family protein [uncultured Cohaesibacter sp.]|uniref:CaiB/BaiF CoA transferase family protein n=1 Tax=uncultured Cohaesibacter sp. TaxID=1002546 RepID=UPI0029316115|nr:CaiB/BaiF CoA-transferase family protein [uncultured Cohaesibacter sp.]
MTTGALEGLRVLDLGRVLSAPFCTAMLGDMGADVIKIEQPGRGDDSRGFMPRKDDISTYFINFNRSKRGITLNLKTGKDVFLELVKNVDVVVENFRPGVMKKLGLDYDELKKVNPRLIYAAISGFGQTGPYSSRAGYDTMAQAMAGIMSVTGFPGSEPTRCGASVADIMGGLQAVIGILAALRHREKSGEGQMVDVALVDVSVVGLSSVNQVYLTTGRVPQRNGNSYESSAPGGGYSTKDGYFVMNGSAPKFWAILCNAMNKPELIEDERFKTNSLRVTNKHELDAIITEWTKTMTTDELMDLLLPLGFAVAPVMTLDKVAADPHIAGVRHMFGEVEHPQVGKIRVTNQAVKMSATNPEIKRSSPLLGEHNKEIYLEELGFSEERFEEMQREEIV